MRLDPLARVRELPEHVRAYYYRVALAAGAVAAILHPVAPEHLETVLELVAAILGLGAAGLATVHTARPRPPRRRVRRGQPVPDHDPATDNR